MGVADEVVAGSLVLPPLDRYGITRVGDVTDLDVIGIPVWFASRPNARSLSVSQGKGLSHEQARISAIMESLEAAVAEQTRPLVARFASYEKMLSQQLSIVPLSQTARCSFPQLDRSRDRAWVAGTDHGSGRPVFAPYELVGMDMRAEFPWDYRTFTVSSNGLASGPDFAFAAVAALFELVERHAIALSEMFGFGGRRSRPFNYREGLHEGLDEAVAKVRAAGLEPQFFEIVSDIDVPVVGAVIARPVLDRDGSGYRLSGGYGCRLDIRDAALAALLEAVQSRLTNIAGARDDMEHTQYLQPKADAMTGAPPSTPSDACLASLVKKYPPVRSPLSKQETLDMLIERLGNCGYRQVAFFDLEVPIGSFKVVRAVAPRLRLQLNDVASFLGVEDLDRIVSM